MARSKSMGLGAMLLLLVLSVVLLPMIVRYVNRMENHYMISGFQNMNGGNKMNGPDEENSNDDSVQDIPAIGSASKLPTWRPDPNTNYLCRSPNENGQPCPEGMFCDGTTQSCVPNYVGGPVPSLGYFS
jgi:hypothetical protein